MLTREDRVVLVQKSDGSAAVEHADGTRITSWYQPRPDEDEPTPTGEDSVPGPSGEDEAPVPRERVVSVEKDGCATVLVFPERRAARVVLADGTVVTATNRGTYEASPARASGRGSRCRQLSDSRPFPPPQVCLPNAGSLEIDGGGTCTYVPAAAGGAPGAVYRMSHTARVACDITDPEGNHFQVLPDPPRLRPRPGSCDRFCWWCRWRKTARRLSAWDHPARRTRPLRKSFAGGVRAREPSWHLCWLESDPAGVLAAGCSWSTQTDRRWSS